MSISNCTDCGKEISKFGKRCRGCSNRNRKGTYKLSEKGRKNISLSKIGKVSGMMGKKMSLHAKELLRKSHLGIKHSIETKKKIAMASSKRKHSQSTKLKISLHNKGKHFHEGKKKEKVGIICKFCFKEFFVVPYQIKIRKFCSWSCSNNNNSRFKEGSLNNNWQGGKSFELYPLGWTKTFKEQVRLRDNYKCQVCGCSEVENNRRLSIHHIDYDKKNLNINNLISLCNSCHTKTNKKRNYWENYFEEKKCQSVLII